MRRLLSSEQASKVSDVASARKGLGLKEAEPLGTLLACSIPVALQEARTLQDGARFKAAFDNAGDAMTIIDADYRVVAFNHASENLTGWPAEQAMGEPCWDIYLCGQPSTRRQDGHRCPLEQKRRRGHSGSYLEHTFTNRKGHKVLASMSEATLPPSPYDGEGHRIIIVHDIAHPEQLGGVELEVLSMVSHELLSPLTVIKGYAATLLHLGGSITEEQRQQYLKAIDAASNRLTRVVENFLYVSRFEADHPDILVEHTSLPSLLQKAVAGIQEQATQHAIKLRLPHCLPRVKVDRRKIEQLMANLLANAVKYSPEGGDIEVSAKPVWDEDELVANLGERPGVKPPCVIVAIQDSGMGIAEDELEQVFDKFYRANNKLTRATSGAGLGLYICKAIVEAHGGHIRARSTPGKGSNFAFCLPIDQPPPGL